MAIQQSSDLRANPVDDVIRAHCLKRALYECPGCNCVFNYAPHFTAHIVSHFKAEALRGCKRLPLGQPGDNEAKKKKEDANAEGDAMEDSVGPAPGATA
ncbi:hypothetical protein SLEP1_g23712 [Rubroshorea leprosula]|uniref:C2H2-type domain-containing protein n=1 Tax=Rubroshorea leprosula TaxID=152421 RepID=A0AAV5JM11_9ROSI|nr:hypothetical protein SLEP1_g23712 [Rubroshorea leprosula]